MIERNLSTDPLDPATENIFTSWDDVATQLGLTPGSLASILTTNGDIITRTAGVPARITRAALAADPAFTSQFLGGVVAQVSTSNTAAQNVAAIAAARTLAAGKPVILPAHAPGSWYAINEEINLNVAGQRLVCVGGNAKGGFCELRMSGVSAGSVRSVVALAEDGVGLEGVSINANNLATYGIYDGGGRTADVIGGRIRYALKDGIHMAAGFNNNQNKYQRLGIDTNGRIYGTTAGLAALTTTGANKSTSAGTVAVTSGSYTLTGTSTVWTTLGLRKGDPLLVKSGGNTYWGFIGSVDSNTQITMIEGVSPSFTASGCDWAIGSGDGIHQEYSGDNNVAVIDQCEIRSNGGVGIRAACLYGPRVQGETVLDFNGFHGMTIGAAYADANYHIVLDGPYFEGHPGFDVVSMFAAGLNITEPLWTGVDRHRLHGLVVQNPGQITWQGRTYDAATHVTNSIIVGYGTPEGAVIAPIGSMFARLDGSTSTTLYVKTSGTGNTGWTAK